MGRRKQDDETKYNVRFNMKSDRAGAEKRKALVEALNASNESNLVRYLVDWVTEHLHLVPPLK